jgi:alcohol dehydrogenase
VTTASLFMTPERVIFGQGVAQQAGQQAKELGAKKVFVVTDRIIAGLDVFTAILKSFEAEGIASFVYSDVDVNPSDVQVEKGAVLYQSENADLLVAVGGGSPLDSAKAIGILVSNGGAIRDYNYEVDDDWVDPDADLISKSIPPLITIPTTSGTGAEVTAFAVITNTKDKYKMFPGSWRSLPKIALVDPEMTASMPPKVTASTGMDALSHAVEAYCSPYAMTQTDILALSAITKVAENLGPAVANGADMKAREGMAMASMEGGLCMNAWCGAVHALGHQLSSQFGMPHGMAMAIMMPPVMEFNTIACMDRMVDIAKALGQKIDGLSKMEAARKAPEAVRAITAAIGLPTSLSACAVDESRFAECARWAIKDIDLDGNPREMNLEQAEALYRKAL